MAALVALAGGRVHDHPGAWHREHPEAGGGQHQPLVRRVPEDLQVGGLAATSCSSQSLAKTGLTVWSRRTNPAFSPLMTSIVMRVPVADAGEATGVLVTVNQLALVVGVATFGTLYLNLAGRLPGHGGADGFRLLSAHAMSDTCLALAAAALAGGLLALARAVRARSWPLPGQED
jgi:hypothetical protein